MAADYFKTFQDLNAAGNQLQTIIGSDVYKNLSFWSWQWLKSNIASQLTPIITIPGIPAPTTSYFDFFILTTKNAEHFRGTPQINNNKPYYKLDPNTTDDSVKAYSDGHGVALQYASAAANAGNVNINGNPVSLIPAATTFAYAVNAFYDHFLTDMFSAGHMRTPRRYLHSSDGTTDLLTARRMHQEDSEYGLFVTNGSGQAWQAFGDGFVFLKTDGIPDFNQVNPANKANWDNVKLAVATSVDEISSAVDNPGQALPKPSSYQILNIIPVVFPPGAVVYSDSNIDDYTVKMTPSNKTPTITDYYMADLRVGETDSNPSVMAPKFLGKYAIGTFLPFLAKYAAEMYRTPVGGLTKPVWELVTTGGSGTKWMGKQTYPLYVIAVSTDVTNNVQRLFVRIQDDPINCNLYTTAHYHATGDPTINDFDSKTPPPFPTPRLQGQQEGYPLPTNIAYPPSGGTLKQYSY